MAVDFDPSDDFTTVADGLSPVTLTRPGSDLSIEVPGALRRAVLRRDTMDSDGRYTASDFVWHLPVASLAETPQAGDILVDDADDRWTILGVRPATFGSRWHCMCRNLVSAHGLDETVDIERAVIVRTDAGAEQLSWQPWRADLPARIQPADTSLEPSDERTATVARFRIYLLDDIEIDATCRVRASDGTTYRILGSHRRRRLDELMYLSVQRDP
jgi:hypothetical protein